MANRKGAGKLLKQVVLWGGTGQAKVVRPIFEHYGSRVIAVFDDTPGLKPPFDDIPLYAGVAGFDGWAKGKDLRKTGFCIAIGNPNGRARLRLSEFLQARGLLPVTLIHPTAWVAESAFIGQGTQIMAGAIVGCEARIGEQCIINTKASVDHEDILEDAVEVSPGATLCGEVRVGVNGWICAGATVLPRIKIGHDAIVGAGAVVLRDVPAATTVIGIPARLMENNGRKK
jgi:sugar O-acyltransferase (sialic acid O-acetyltransferase NeuD family)